MITAQSLKIMTDMEVEEVLAMIRVRGARALVRTKLKDLRAEVKVDVQTMCAH